jgi:hypothetical protein
MKYYVVEYRGKYVKDSGLLYSSARIARKSLTYTSDINLAYLFNGRQIVNNGTNMLSSAAQNHILTKCKVLSAIKEIKLI